MAQRWGHGPGDKSGRTGDESVDDRRTVTRRGAQHGPGQHPDLETADFGKQVEAVFRVRIVNFNRPAHHVDLMGQSRVVQAGAPAGGHLWVGAGHDRSYGTGGSGIADAHVPEGDEVGAFGDLIVGGRYPGFDALDGVLAGHRRPGGDIRGATANLDQLQ